MNSGFVPIDLGGAAQAPAARARPDRTRSSRRARSRARASGATGLTWCVLMVAVLLEAAVLWRPQALSWTPLQGTPVFKMASGYTMLALLAFALVFGWLRRLPAMARHHRQLNEVHQLGGLLLLVLLALHVGARPAGFLLWTFHALAIGLGAGALREVLRARIGRAASAALLTLHISFACLVGAAALLHLYFVYAYTA